MDPLKKAGMELIWFDSMGAKSMSVYFNCGLIIDPGAAAMQPSYPLPPERKSELREEALRRIAGYLKMSTVVIVTHYHYDHIVNLPSRSEFLPLFLRKFLCLKDPNKYINASQWMRAREIIGSILNYIGIRLEDRLISPRKKKFKDPVTQLVHALSRSFGDYKRRREVLLKKGSEWFRRLTEKWRGEMWIDELSLKDGTKISWCDGKAFTLRWCSVKALEPWFHGIAYSRTGWIIPLVIESRGIRVFYSSDVMGPEVEDYADKIIDLKPDVIVLDGPPTYLFPYMLNRINLQRAVENAIRIIKDGRPELVIYDHHLLRERRWRSRVRDVFKAAKKEGVRVVTAAEELGERPLIDTL